MDAIGIVKTVAQITVSFSAATVVTNVIKSTTPVELSRMSKIAIGVGTFAISSMIGDMVAKYVTDQIDDVRDQITSTKVEILDDSNE